LGLPIQYRLHRCEGTGLLSQHGLHRCEGTGLLIEHGLHRCQQALLVRVGGGWVLHGGWR